jgi:hypothetical protein
MPFNLLGTLPVFLTYSPLSATRNSILSIGRVPLKIPVPSFTKIYTNLLSLPYSLQSYHSAAPFAVFFGRLANILRTLP